MTQNEGANVTISVTYFVLGIVLTIFFSDMIKIDPEPEREDPHGH